MYSSSYRTYEEWKQKMEYRGVNIDGYGSYRTYEEWKPGKPGTGKTLSAVRSYRTYEEWKHEIIISDSIVCYRFLPYL